MFWVVIITINCQNLPNTIKNLPKTKLPKTNPNPNHNPNSKPLTLNCIKLLRIKFVFGLVFVDLGSFR